VNIQILRHFRVVGFLTLALLLVLAGTFLLPTKAQETTEEQVWYDRAGLEYVCIPPGSFQMGAVPGDSEARDDESPRHLVTITRGFWMSRTEVTVRAYRQFCEETGHSMPPEPVSPLDNINLNPGWRNLDHPIVNVSWHDAVAYCEWAGVHLPTEAEWEYAARGGQEGWKYVWGNQDLPIVNGIKQANVLDEAYRREHRESYEKIRESIPWFNIFEGYDDGYGDLAPVGLFATNGFGLYDMAGNVCEWCADWYYRGYYGSPGSLEDPHGPSWGIRRVNRGGSWGHRSLRVSYRVRNSPGNWSVIIGFRCVRDVDILVGPDATETVTAEPVTEEQVWSYRAGLEYVFIPPGEFMMGAVPGDSQARRDENPRHSVTIARGFMMSRTEVTVRAYRRFCEETGRSMPREPVVIGGHNFNPGWSDLDHPISNVTWHDAVAYCEWAGVRLPTEAEWEYAARGGQGGRIYVWGNNRIPIVNGITRANVADEATQREHEVLYIATREDPSGRDILEGYDDGFGDTSPVGSFAANGFGLYDMTGNVWEWCSDWYDEDYYSRSPSHDPQGPSSGIYRILRGGCWLIIPSGLRVSCRARLPPGSGRPTSGFRCVRDLE